LQRIAFQPLAHIKLVELFAPQHSSEGLALYAPQVLVNDILLKVSIERVRLAQALAEHAVEFD
jgi:hypothetical protein